MCIWMLPSYDKTDYPQWGCIWFSLVSPCVTNYSGWFWTQNCIISHLALHGHHKSISNSCTFISLLKAWNSMCCQCHILSVPPSYHPTQKLVTGNQTLVFWDMMQSDWEVPVFLRNLYLHFEDIIWCCLNKSCHTWSPWNLRFSQLDIEVKTWIKGN